MSAKIKFESEQRRNSVTKNPTLFRPFGGICGPDFLEVSIILNRSVSVASNCLRAKCKGTVLFCCNTHKRNVLKNYRAAASQKNFPIDLGTVRPVTYLTNIHNTRNAEFGVYRETDEPPVLRSEATMGRTEGRHEMLFDTMNRMHRMSRIENLIWASVAAPLASSNALPSPGRFNVSTFQRVVLKNQSQELRFSKFSTPFFKRLKLEITPCHINY